MIHKLLAAALLIASTTLTGTAVAVEEPDSGAPSVTPAQKIYPYVQPGIVFIESTWSAKIYDTYNEKLVRGEPFTVGGACTGFVVSPDGYIATAGHCLNALDETYDIDQRFDILGAAVNWAEDAAWFTDGSTRDQIIDHAAANWKLVSPTSDVGDRIRQPVLSVKVSWGANVSGIAARDGLTARVMGRSTFDNGDIGLLKVNAENLNALTLAEGTAETGEELLAIGYPGKVDAVVDDDYTPSVKPGTVSSYKTVGGEKTSVYEISAAIQPGMSGGPTVNLQGEVLGVNSFGAGDSEAFNFVRPVSLVREMMGSVEPSQSDETKQYTTGLDAYFDGDKKAALSNLKAVAEDQPANGIVQTYIDKAEELKDPPPPPKDEGISWTLVGAIGGGLLLLLALVGGLVVLMRRRRGRVVAPSVPATTPGPAYGASGATPSVAAPSGVSESPAGDIGEPTRHLAASAPMPGDPSSAGVPPGTARMQSDRVAQTGFRAPIGDTGRSTASTTRHVPTQGEAPAAESAAPAGALQFCTSCGTKLVPGTKFCGECGTRL